MDGDPDVDAIFRLTRKDDGVQLDLRFDPKAPPVLIPPGAYTPYNCQNTLHFYDAFWGLVLPPSGTLRVTDIWRSFFVQRLLQEINGYLGYFGPTAYQVFYHLINVQFANKLIFCLVNKNQIPRKNLLKVVKFQNLLEKCCNVWKI